MSLEEKLVVSLAMIIFGAVLLFVAGPVIMQ